MWHKMRYVLKTVFGVELRTFLFIILALQVMVRAGAQISPGDLSKPHEHLEGIPNCTKCHILGNKITGEKCLGCHTEINERISAGKGYHSSSEIKGKECIECHSEHHGKNFQLVRFNTVEFNHSLTGYTLSTPHSRLECVECHDPRFITDQNVKAKKFTYLGVNDQCLTCHEDYHLGTLSSSCLNCHGPETFKTIPSFNHDKARFKLIGKHKNVECTGCHKFETVNGSRFQEFRGVLFSSCVNCHKDPHENKFGQNCRQCHSEVSFTTIKGMSNFDHDKTSFPLEEKHIQVACNECHKTRLTDRLKYSRCTDCHTDYHKGQFARDGGSPDCSTCHSVKGFESFSYTLDQHNKSQFPLKGAHTAQPCVACHKKQAEWSFKKIGTECNDCHIDIHKSYINDKYYPGEKCLSCHNENSWRNISFDHAKTAFPLTGAHSKTTCSVCHITRTGEVIVKQKFFGLPSNCSACHNDNHQGQFSRNGENVCTDCHITDSWEPSKFNHNNTLFRLDGKHVNVPCSDCHKVQQTGTLRFTLYKIKDFRCESCHF